MTTINPDRGEVGLKLKDELYPMLPTRAAYSAIEQRLGPLMALTYRSTDAEKLLTLRELAVIAAETIRAAGKDRENPMLANVTESRLEDLMYEEGMAAVFDAMQQVLINLVSGGTTLKKTPQTEPTPPSA